MPSQYLVDAPQLDDDLVRLFEESDKQPLSQFEEARIERAIYATAEAIRMRRPVNEIRNGKRISLAERMRIRRLKASGETILAISRRMNLERSTVRQILLNKPGNYSRCSGCGAMVRQPCKVCRTAAPRVHQGAA